MNITIHIPHSDTTSPSGTYIETLERHVKDPVKYLERSDYPEDTIAIYRTPTGTLQYRRHFRGWRVMRQTVGP